MREREIDKIWEGSINGPSIKIGRIILTFNDLRSHTSLNEIFAYSLYWCSYKFLSKSIHK